MRPREHADFDRDRPDLVALAAVGAHPVPQDHLAQLVPLDLVQDLADEHGLVAVPLGQRRHGVLRDDIELLLPRVLPGDADRVAQAARVARAQLGLELAHVHGVHDRALRLARDLRELVLDGDDATDVLHRELERGDHVRLGHLAAAALDHDDVACRARDDHVHVGLVELREGRHDDPLAVHAAHAHGGDGLGERDVGQHQRRGAADQRQHVGIVLLVRRHDGRHDLGLVGPLLVEQRTDRPVDLAARKRLLLRGTPFALEESARDLARGVRALAVIAGQRHEIEPRLRGLRGTRRHQHDRAAELHDGGAARELGPLAGADRELLAAQVHRYFVFSHSSTCSLACNRGLPGRCPPIRACDAPWVGRGPSPS